MNQAFFDVSDVMPLALATGLFVSSFTAQQPDGVISGPGVPSGNYSNVSGLTAISCMDAPDVTAQVKVGAFQQRAGAQVLSEANRHVLLDDYYPTLQDGWRGTGTGPWIAVVDGVTYNIFGAESDSQRTQTRVKLQRATV